MKRLSRLLRIRMLDNKKAADNSRLRARGGPLGLEVLGVTVYELCVAGHSFWAVFEWLVLKTL